MWRKYGKIQSNMDKHMESMKKLGETMNKFDFIMVMFNFNKNKWGVNNGTLECHEEQTGVLRWKVMLN